MDPLTQGIVATTASQSVSNKEKLLIASILGFLSGLAPDIDIFIRSTDDPLLFLEFHRQFTHSLLFIPLGGLVCSSVFYFIFAKKFNFTFKEFSDSSEFRIWNISGEIFNCPLFLGSLLKLLKPTKMK